jgi:hypothetical protein
LGDFNGNVGSCHRKREIISLPSSAQVRFNSMNSIASEAA